MQTEGQNSPKYEVWQPFLMAVMVAIGMLVGYKMNEKSDHLIEKVEYSGDIKMGRIEELLRFIEARYVDTLNSDEIITAAINGMLNKLDPHSLYLGPKELIDISENMEGSFKGIGIESLFIEDTVVIQTVVKDSPAFKAGLRQFDQIVAIDDTIVAGVKKPFDSIRNMLRRNDRSVKVEIKRSGEVGNRLKLIKVDNIAIHSADVAYMVNDSVGYIEIKQFSSNTYQEFMENVEYLYEKNKMKHLILDLRGNPGGYLPQAVKIMNQLIREKDLLIVYTEGRNHTRQDYRTNGKSFYGIDKIAVLVDENSASGSEVIAGAIQDHDRGIIIGRRTFGKGLVQEQFNLSNGGALRLTTARYFTPCGRSIQKEFTDLESYESETENRSKYEPLHLRDKSNSKEYKTLKLGRKVYSGIGIDPEVFIPGDSSHAKKEYVLLENYALQYVATQMVRGKINQKKKPDFRILAKDYSTFISQKEKTLISEKLYPIAVQFLDQKYQYLINNGDGDKQAQLLGADDTYVKAALKYTQSKIQLR